MFLYFTGKRNGSQGMVNRLNSVAGVSEAEPGGILNEISDRFLDGWMIALSWPAKCNHPPEA